MSFICYLQASFPYIAQGDKIITDINFTVRPGISAYCFYPLLTLNNIGFWSWNLWLPCKCQLLHRYLRAGSTRSADTKGSALSRHSCSFSHPIFQWNGPTRPSLMISAGHGTTWETVERQLISNTGSPSTHPPHLSCVLVGLHQARYAWDLVSSWVSSLALGCDCWSTTVYFKEKEVQTTLKRSNLLLAYPA